jgi:hypothetical protein
MTAREVRAISLEEALALTALVAEKTPLRLEQFASRWLQRYLEARPGASAAETAYVAVSLRALSEKQLQQAALAGLRLLLKP